MKNPLLVPELREYLEKKDSEFLREFIYASHPRDTADYLSALTPKEIWDILSYASPGTRAEIFSHLDTDIQIEMGEHLRRGEMASLISDMPPDDRVDLLKRIPEEKRETLLPAIAQAEREDIRRLSLYREGTAGAAMTSEYVTLSTGITAAEAIAKIRREAPNKETIYYAYVVDSERKMIGFVSLKDLILARPSERIEDIMHEEVIYAYSEDDQEKAARMIQKYDLIALPVLNEQNALVGIITHDDALDIITQEQTEDIEKLMAITGLHEDRVYLRTPAMVHFRNRSYWVVALAMLGIVSGYIIHSFEATLVQFLVLAFYLPMMADTGGNTGSQSATVVIRALALNEITPGDALKVLFKEAKIAIMMAMILGVLAYGKVMFLSGAVALPEGFNLPMIGFAIAVALSIQVVTSTLVGALLPLAVARLKFDPAVVASPALTTIVDISGLLIYFTTVHLILGIGA